MTSLKDLDQTLDFLAQMAEEGKIDISTGTPLYGEDAQRAIEGTYNRGRPNLGAEKAQNTGRSPKIQCRVPSELKEQLENYSRTHETSVSSVVQAAITEYLQARSA